MRLFVVLKFNQEFFSQVNHEGSQEGIEYNFYSAEADQYINLSIRKIRSCHLITLFIN